MPGYGYLQVPGFGLSHLLVLRSTIVYSCGGRLCGLCGGGFRAMCSFPCRGFGDLHSWNRGGDRDSNGPGGPQYIFFEYPSIFTCTLDLLLMYRLGLPMEHIIGFMLNEWRVVPSSPWRCPCCAHGLPGVQLELPML